ncbi:MAG TPA: ABC transporter permease [Microlunatus sp.]|jgi:teichoic acid transport system permease protein|nr:ABC transporter permease [Microlunatus sp.]
MTAPPRVHHGEREEFEPVYHQYGPHRAGLPPLVPYFRELWARREFAAEMSRASLRSANVNTVFGQLWLVLNPLLLAGVYYLLVTIIRQRHDPELFTHLVLALFAFTMVQTAASTGATSVTGSGRLLINTAFPRLLIPLSAVRTAFWRFLPTIPVYLAFHIIFGLTWHPRMLVSLYFLLTMVVFSMGLAALFATCQVYFRDTSSFLPYFLRLWMYLSPVLWLPEMLSHMGRATRLIVELNPMYPMLTGYAHLLQGEMYPPLWMWIASAAWAIGAVIIGFLFFVSREREFAVRLT